MSFTGAYIPTMITMIYERMEPGDATTYFMVPDSSLNIFWEHSIIDAETPKPLTILQWQLTSD